MLVHDTEIVLRSGKALFGGLPVPLHRLSIILRLAFQEGRTDARIAVLLGLEEHNVRYRRQRAVKGIRGAFAEAGFTAEALFGEQPS